MKNHLFPQFRSCASVGETTEKKSCFTPVSTVNKEPFSPVIIFLSVSANHIGSVAAGTSTYLSLLVQISQSVYKMVKNDGARLSGQIFFHVNTSEVAQGHTLAQTRWPGQVSCCCPEHLMMCVQLFAYPYQFHSCTCSHVFAGTDTNRPNHFCRCR